MLQEHVPSAAVCQLACQSSGCVPHLNALRKVGSVAKKREACRQRIADNRPGLGPVHRANDACEPVNEHVLAAQRTMADAVRQVLQEQTGIAVLDESV